MEESAEFAGTEFTAVPCSYAAVSKDFEPACDSTKAKCNGANPQEVWKKNMYSICKKECPCCVPKDYGVSHVEVTGRVFSTMTGFEVLCRLYGFHLDCRSIWDGEEIKKRRRELGLTR